MDDTYPDLFEEAAQLAVRQAFEYAAFLGAIARAVARHRVVKQRERELARETLQAQQEAERAATRARWAPANDPDWIGEAELLDTAVVWCAAVPYADADDTALSAARNCETRLRVLHPHAMARYDRLRGDGTGPLDAMRQAAPLFMRRTDVHDQPDVPRRLALEPGNGLGHSWVAAMQGPSREEFEAYQTALSVLRRGSQILHGLQARAASNGLPPLGEDDQRVALENVTSLPPAAISHVVSPARRPWQQDFPFPIKEVLAVAAADTRKLPAAPKKAITRTERGVPS